MFSSLTPRKRRVLLAGAAIAFSVLLALLTTTFTCTGDLDGLYLLKGAGGKPFELRDDVLLGEYSRVILKVEFGALFASSREYGEMRSRPVLRYQWKKVPGHGFIQSLFPDGTRFLISFSRFVSEDGLVPSGLFVGGGLPYGEYRDGEVVLNETGMAYFSGAEWRHLWCNANEAIVSGRSAGTARPPTRWEYLGSKVLYDHDGALVIKSSHRADLDDMPVRIDRFAFYRAGDRYLLLLIRIRNDGTQDAAYTYVYGDEPWVGDYGSSAGNVGWTRDRVYEYESFVDTRKYSWAGMWDAGNRALPEERGKRFSGIANFIEWLGDARPDDVFFSNQMEFAAPESRKTPLASPNNRVLSLMWRHRLLRPGRADVIMLAVGMADNDPATGFPVKPEVTLNPGEVSYVLGLPD